MQKTWVGFLWTGIITLALVILWLAGMLNPLSPIVMLPVFLLIATTFQAIRNKRRSK